MSVLSTTANQDAKRLQVEHVEAADMTQHSEKPVESERLPEAQGREQAELPKGYFYSAYFIGSYCVWIFTPSSTISLLLYYL